MPNGLKPLMIRGDRLLLALEVIEYVVHFCRYDCPRVARWAADLQGVGSFNPRRCTREQVLAVLRTRCSFTPKPCPRGPNHDAYCVHYSDVPLGFTDGFPGCITSLLHDQRDAGILNEQRFALAEWAIGHTACGGGLDGAVVHSLFRLIASGELTEADFREED